MPTDASRLHREAVVADTHNDLLMAVTVRPPGQWADYFRARWLPQLRTGGVNVQVLPVFSGWDHETDGALKRTLRMIEAAHRLAEGNADAVALCRDAAEIDAALAGGRVALVLALESCTGIGSDVELFATLYRLGVRVASLTHMGRTAFADGSGEDATGGRLTAAGVAAVAEMHRLGMLLDVSHLGAGGVGHVLELGHGPVIATHSSARALRDHHRNLTDAQLRGIAATGGVVCVNFFASFLHETEHTVDKIVDHIEHIAGVAGIDHVGLGPDFLKEVDADLTPPWSDGMEVEGLDVHACVPGLEGPAGLPLVTEALLRRGFTEEDTARVLGGNVLALLRRVLG
ncbi:dipeptidase [Spongiactinospora sp. 9N601]|uniref:dipeptidase n=1 Tax=Spongiactinospora sp. 9N601 TaxID=3375149 RepID=UPI003788C047